MSPGGLEPPTLPDTQWSNMRCRRSEFRTPRRRSPSTDELVYADANVTGVQHGSWIEGYLYSWISRAGGLRRTGCPLPTILGKRIWPLSATTVICAPLQPQGYTAKSSRGNEARSLRMTSICSACGRVGISNPPEDVISCGQFFPPPAAARFACHASSVTTWGLNIARLNCIPKFLLGPEVEDTSIPASFAPRSPDERGLLARTTPKHWDPGERSTPEQMR
ncbi:hypothetical protein FB451DRAFT_1189109 [Mycena latifolia]|nr:hypothetical protein FB451DRAFT_1189109 [Mycena latifolia]